MRVLLAGILGGIAMFVWSTIAHVATPLATVGIATLPDEAAVIGTLDKTVGNAHGLFLFPNQMAAGANAPKEGPFGFLVYRAHVSYALQPSNLLIEFGTELTESILAAFLLSLAALSTYLGRLGFVTLIGVTASIATNLPYWNWYGFSGRYSLAQIFIVVVGYLAAGLVIAWFVRGQASEAAAV